ncbi:hypothetical protein [Clostridium sp.]|uniref:hypothetical protein n=1 Tax=Clostridium sp. TaxID=1506 RepID=UPI002617E8C2|nr:hypothetical protein [Clostridium sp.]
MRILLKIGVINIKNNKLILVYVVLITIFKLIGLNTMLTSSVIMLLLILIENKYKSLNTMLVLSIFAPSYLITHGVIIYVLLKSMLSKLVIKKDINFKFYITFISLSLISYSISLVNDFSFIPLIIYGFMIFSLYYMYFVFKSDKEDNLKEFYYLCKLQIIPVVAQCIFLLKNGTFYPDCITGTCDNANTISIILLIYLILIYKDSTISFNKKVYNLIVYGFIIYLSGAKLISLIFIFIIITINVFVNFEKKTLLKISITLFVLSLIIVSLPLTTSLLKNVVDENNLNYYITNDNMNLKFRAYKYTFNNINGVNNLIGVGVGRYGSKTANLLAYDTMYKPDDKLMIAKFLKPKTNEEYRYIASSFTKSFFENISNFSGVLSYPQNSIVTIKGEIGYLGLLLFSLFILFNIRFLYKNMVYKINYKESYCSIIFIVSLAILSFFDNFLEMNNVMLLFMFILSLAYKFNYGKESIK